MLRGFGIGCSGRGARAQAAAEIHFPRNIGAASSRFRVRQFFLNGRAIAGSLINPRAYNTDARQ
jgi:hypothetical protein